MELESFESPMNKAFLESRYYMYWKITPYFIFLILEWPSKEIGKIKSLLRQNQNQNFLQFQEV